MGKYKCPKCGSWNVEETNAAGRIVSDVASGLVTGGCILLRKMLAPHGPTFKGAKQLYDDTRSGLCDTIKCYCKSCNHNFSVNRNLDDFL